MNASPCVLIKSKNFYAALLRMKEALRSLQEASFLDRNPYWHTKAAKQHIKELEESAQELQEQVLLYSALLVKTGYMEQRHLCSYAVLYEVLFLFQEDVKKHELEHLLLIRDEKMTQRLQQFLDYSMRLAMEVMQQADKEKKRLL